MIWAPEASCASFITSMDAYFPVPTMSREENSLPPRTRFVSFMPLSPTHRSYDFHLVTRVEARRRVGALGRDLAVHRHGRVLALDTQVRQQRLHAGALGDLVLFAVHRDPHKQNGRNPRRVRPRSSLARHVPFAGITQSRFEGSRAAPGSQESSPHGDTRSIPPHHLTARLPARRRSARTTARGRPQWASVMALRAAGFSSDERSPGSFPRY